MTDFDVLMEMLEEAEALLLEPREVFDVALIGITEGGMGREVAVYDSAKCIAALAAQNDWDKEEAVEFFNFNTLGAYVGEATPLFVNVAVREAA